MPETPVQEALRQLAEGNRARAQAAKWNVYATAVWGIAILAFMAFVSKQS